MEECLETLCRICLQSAEHEDLTEITSMECEIAQKLNQISGIILSELSYENEQAFICSACLKELYKCIMFRKKCQSSDEYFKMKMKTDNKPIQEPNGQEDLSEFHLLKLEPFGEEAVDDDISFEPCEFQTEEILVDQFQGEVEQLDVTDEDDLSKAITPTAFVRRGRAPKTDVNSKKTILSCQYCGLTLSRRNRLIQHERLHIIGETKQFYECFICGKTFNQRFGLVPHFRKHHNFKPGPKEKWKCAICVDKILPPGNLALHYEREHTTFIKTGRPVSTQALRESAAVLKPKSRSSNRRRRVPKSNEPKNFWPCSICGNSFSNYIRYQKHLKDVHETNVNEVIQDTAALKNSIAMNESVPTKVVEEGEKASKFPCKTCGKVYASVMTVRAHEKTHLNIEYLCDLCNSSFRVKAYLTAHVQKVHLKLKRFKCSFENCSAAFVHRELFNYHVRKHLNIRNFACRYCQKTFTTKSCCTIHERIHTDERPYNCKFCDRTFIHHSDHRRHEQKHITDNEAAAEKRFRSEQYHVIN